MHINVESAVGLRRADQEMVWFTLSSFVNAVSAIQQQEISLKKRMLFIASDVSVTRVQIFTK